MPIGSVLKPHVQERHIASWQQLYDQYLKLGRDVQKWIFRGQKDSSWGLETTLERIVSRFGWELRKSPNIEKGLIRRFKRQSHHHSTDLPNPDHALEWLALMQHHGTPTRLQDWTYSFFVAVYFAIEQADKAAGVWALDRSVINSALRSTVPGDVQDRCLDDRGYIDSQKCFNSIFDRDPPLSLVAP